MSKMVTFKRVQAGEYTASDGRFIIKDGSSWFVLNNQEQHEFGPLPTLSAAKEYVQTGKT